MPNQAFNLEAYFKRINYDGPTDVSYETLVSSAYCTHYERTI